MVPNLIKTTKENKDHSFMVAQEKVWLDHNFWWNLFEIIFSI
jgi:hypothetical protein